MNGARDKFLDYMKENHDGNNPLLRVHMNKEERKYAAALAKLGMLTKGRADTIQHTVIYYYDESLNAVKEA